MKYIISFLFVAFASLTWAQEGHRIEIEIDNYKHDTIIVGFYYGEQTLILDSLYSEDQKHFVIEGQDTLDQGIYLFLTQPKNEFTQFLINEDQHFTIKTDTQSSSEVSFEGSEENTLFYEYLGFLGDQREELARIDTEKEAAKAASQDTSSFIMAKDETDAKVRARQLEIIDSYPETTLRLLMDANIPLEAPEFEGTQEEIQRQKYYWFRTHYFDRIHLDNPATLLTPFIHQRIDYYITKLTPMVPDSISKSIDGLLTLMEPAENLYRYYLSHFLNRYAKSKIVGFDAVYVHLVDNYYAKGKAPWVSEENMKKIKKNARGIRPTLAGKPARDFTVYTEDGTPITLSKIDSDYTVLFFWAPDCGHCKKAIPDIVEFNEKWKDRSVTLLSICNRSGDKYEQCWAAVKEKGMESLTNVGDQKRIATVLSKYYVTSTPKIYIIGKDQKIILKGIGAPQLEEVMESIIKADAEKEKQQDEIKE